MLRQITCNQSLSKKKSKNLLSDCLYNLTVIDHYSLPYVEAVIRESMRISSSLPLSLLHKCIKDTTLGGYNIPANTPVFTNLSAMHHDPDLWGDPDNFRPERFIDEKGELIKDMSLPFGLGVSRYTTIRKILSIEIASSQSNCSYTLRAGHRVCPGETYSRHTMFEIVSVMLQNFNLYQIEGQPSKPGDDLPGLLVTPKEFWVRYEVR